MMEHFSLLGTSGIAGLLELFLSAYWNEGEQVEVCLAGLLSWAMKLCLCWCPDAYLGVWMSLKLAVVCQWYILISPQQVRVSASSPITLLLLIQWCELPDVLLRKSKKETCALHLPITLLIHWLSEVAVLNQLLTTWKMRKPPSKASIKTSTSPLSAMNWCCPKKKVFVVKKYNPFFSGKI